MKRTVRLESIPQEGCPKGVSVSVFLCDTPISIRATNDKGKRTRGIDFEVEVRNETAKMLPRAIMALRLPPLFAEARPMVESVDAFNGHSLRTKICLNLGKDLKLENIPPSLALSYNDWKWEVKLEIGTATRIAPLYRSLTSYIFRPLHGRSVRQR